MKTTLDAYSCPRMAKIVRTPSRSQRSKVHRYIADRKIEKAQPNMWYVRPLKGCVQDHWVEHDPVVGWTCDCQWWRMKGTACAHIMAVMAFEGMVEI